MAQELWATGIVLAAGGGKRFGMPKVLAEEGRWLRMSVAALRDGGCRDVVVVLGAAVVDVPAGSRAVVADNWADGISASVRTGILAADGSAEFVVLTTVDTPDVGAAAVRRVLSAATEAESGLARARYDGRPGHPVVLARRHWPELLGVLTGDDGAGPFLRGRPDVVDVECADLGTGRDIDERP
ncbi:nucleotidyltransferase family protein [Mycobacterium sp. 236(2023)]|uniref:nucleotidyltransferase family protein n=1 Tax=Mycobacterium sp. 236(2023) TaxID=3038163 RepID=UPI0024154AAC|nr:nucleotidyltransferase family protein [Mycobacterium sp. 236(2023)]MDG4664212.1 nucleotidyltransferase family protein [Mycobacterium sp. 236(2023)]